MSERLFLGIPLWGEAAAELTRQLRDVFPEGIPGRRVPSENWHITLRFLGDVSAESAARLREEMVSGGLGSPFELNLGALGAFPDARRARVLWIGSTQGTEPLRRLAAAVEERVRRAGLAPQERAFAPHLTLARLRDPTDLRAALGSATAPTLRMAVADVVLFRSHLGSGPPRYEVVERFPL